MKVIDLARAVAPECRTETVGIRPGEKLHETMIPHDDSRNTLEYDDYYAILPDPAMQTFRRDPDPEGGRPCPDGFCYASDTNTQWLSADELRRMIGLLEARNVA